MLTYEFIDEKRKNFIKFLRSNLSQVDKSKQPKIEEHLKKLETTSSQEFVQFIIIKLLPNEKTMDQYVQQFATELEIDLHKLSSENVEKIKRYLQCFCDSCK